jgi:DNA polymerase III alpha subunit
MARVHGESREEVMAITKNLDVKDEEGKPITWDAALRLDLDFKSYCEKHPFIAQATKKLINRNRGMGVHAGGLIVSSIPLHDLVPLVKRKDNPHASAWVEGLNGQDLQPVGLVKFDLLVISNLLQIARCCEMVKLNHGVKGICARDGDSDWTDIDSWRNNPESLSMANSGDLKCIFQFDSEGMRALVRSGGVDRFEDLVAYSALFRPGCLASGMTKRYVERKKGREKYSLHPLIDPILEKTYGVMVYQEQIMRILHVVGEIPLKDCEAVRKAISKKKLDSFIKYKEQFILNGQKNLQTTQEELIQTWSQIETFSEYGFNLSHASAYTYISMYLLYLKSHYPHEFYTSMLSCETVSEKIKDIKMEAKIHGVEMHRLDINKSGINFDLRDNLIYFGFSNIKGIGEGPAKKIVSGQPYRSFEDFLYRCGTDASMLKPILGLRCFRDRDPVTLWKFAEHFKESVKKYGDKRKRHVLILKKYEDELQELIPGFQFKLEELSGDNPFDTIEYKKLYDKEEEIEVWKEFECEENEGQPREENEDFFDIELGISINRNVIKYYKKKKIMRSWNRWKDLKKLWTKYQKTIEKFGEADLKTLPKLMEFDPDQYDIPKDLSKLLKNSIACEEEYYGFVWVHELERSPDYKGNFTFEALRSNIDNNVAPVEIKILSCSKIKSKKGKEYHQIVAEDVMQQSNKIIVWSDDWQRWCKEFCAGNLLRIRLEQPSNGFNSFKIETNQKVNFYGQKKYWEKKYWEKEDDPRVLVMRFGKREEEKFMTDEEILEML